MSLHVKVFPDSKFKFPIQFYKVNCHKSNFKSQRDWGLILFWFYFFQSLSCQQRFDGLKFLPVKYNITLIKYNILILFIALISYKPSMINSLNNFIPLHAFLTHIMKCFLSFYVLIGLRMGWSHFHDSCTIVFKLTNNIVYVD